jgi:hypothetical protein
MSTPLFRRLLWVAALFNVFGAGLLGFPASPLGQWAGLPAEVPIAYRVIVAVFVLLFAGCYAWLATQAAPNRPMVALGALGKACVVIAAAVLVLAAEAPVDSLVAASGDLVFVALFLWWLKASAATASGCTFIPSSLSHTERSYHRGE